MGVWTVLPRIGSAGAVEEDFEPTVDVAFLKPVQNGFGPVGSSGCHSSNLWISLQSGATPPWTDEPVDCYRAGNDHLCERLCEQAMRRMPRLPDFSVVVWLRKTDEFTALKAELLGAAATEPYESTEYQGMVDFHWSAANLPEAKRLADALKGPHDIRNLFCYTS
jgi:hypothetical protein